MKNKKINLIILFIAMVLVLYFTLKDDFNGIIRELKNAKLSLFVFCIIIILISLFFKSASLKVFLEEYKKDYSIRKAYQLTLIGQFLNGITPFQSGGQPFQIYLLKKEGVRLSDSTNAMIKDFIAFQIALILVGVLAILVNFKVNISSNNVYLNNLIFLGFTINLIVLVILLIISLAKKTGLKLANKFINILFRFKLTKKLNITHEKVTGSIKYFYKTGNDFKKNKFLFLKCVIYNIMYLILLYLTPFFIFKSIGSNDVPLLGSIIAVAFVMLIGNFIPIPGATGGIEYSFLQFFSYFLKNPVLSGAMLLWRLVTYFVPMIIGFIVLMLKKGEIKNENRAVY